MTFNKRVACLLFAGGLALIFVLLAHAGLTQAQTAHPAVFVPIGGGYEAGTLALFAAQAAQHDSDGVVTIYVLPVTYATDPISITQEERDDNLDWAKYRAGQVCDACKGVVLSPTTCITAVVDIQIRDDADDPVRVAQLDEATDGIFILGGDQTIAMQVVANTATEDALEALYQEGVPIGGTSAGAAVQSRYMIGGYAAYAHAWHGLEWGAVDLWYGPTESVTRGLRFGLDEAVIDQHFLERGRLLRLLQATQRKPGQKVGLGVDWGTGATVVNETLVGEVADWYAALVLDEETYGAAAAAQYRGPYQALSIHDVAVHVLPPGPFSYDLNTRQPIAVGTPGTLYVPAPDISGRDFLLRAPGGAGSLFVTGDLYNDPEGEVMTRFAALAQESGQPTVVLAGGYITGTTAIPVAEDWAYYLDLLGVTEVQTATLLPGMDMEALKAQLGAAGAVFFTGDDQAAMADWVVQLQDAEVDSLLHQSWLSGTVMLFDNAAAAAVGDWMSAEHTPTDDDLIFQASDTFIAGYVYVEPGLGLIPDAVFEPRVSYDYLYGRMVSHVYAHPGAVAWGIQRSTAIEITPLATRVLGEGAVLALDGRYAGEMAAGTNDVIAANWLLLDTFAPGDYVLVPAYQLYLPLVSRLGAVH